MSYERLAASSTYIDPMNDVKSDLHNVDRNRDSDEDRLMSGEATTSHYRETAGRTINNELRSNFVNLIQTYCLANLRELCQAI